MKAVLKRSCLYFYIVVAAITIGSILYSWVHRKEDLIRPSASLMNLSTFDFIQAYERELKSDERHHLQSKDCVSWRDVVTPKHEFRLPTDNDDLNSSDDIELDVGEDKDHRKKSFEKIFETNAWDKHSKSGPGSWLNVTVNMRRSLAKVVDTIKLHLGKNKISFLDSSCGDMGWMPAFLETRSDVEFTGYDIVAKNIENHRRKFKSHKDWRFETHDLVTEPVKTQYDLILSRFTLQHLKTKDVIKVIKNFIQSGSRFFLTTNYPIIRKNTELSENSEYRHRPINLYTAPYYFPPPICYSEDYEGHKIMLWDLSSLSLRL